MNPLPPGVGGGPAAAATAVGGATTLVPDASGGGAHAPSILAPNLAAASSSASPDVLSISYNISKVREHIDGKKWGELEGYLKRFVRCEKSQGDSVIIHAALFIHCRRGQAMQILAERGEEAAYEFHIREIERLGQSSSDFVQLKDLQKDIDAISAGIQNKQLAQPNNLDMMIDDYMRLYFPDIVGHEKKVSELWQFAVRVCVEEEDALSSNKKKRKPGFRCLACQRVFTNHTISIMRDHFLGGNCKICPKSTADILERLKRIPGEVKLKQHSKRAKGSKVKSQDQDDLMMSTDLNLDMARKAYNHLLEATRHSITPSINRGVLQGNLAKAGDFLESLIKSLEASKRSTAGHHLSSSQHTGPQPPVPCGNAPQATSPEVQCDNEVQPTPFDARFGMDSEDFLQADFNPLNRGDTHQLHQEIGFLPLQGAAAHQLLSDRDLAFTSDKWLSPGQLHYYSFGSSSAFQQMGASTSNPELNHDLDSSGWWNGHYDTSEQDHDSEDP